MLEVTQRRQSSSLGNKVRPYTDVPGMTENDATRTPTTVDGLLHVYVDGMNLAEEPTEIGLAMSLLVDGALVSGYVIPNWQWAQEVDRATGGGEEDQDADDKRVLQGFADVLRESYRHRHETVGVPEAEWTDEQREANEAETRFIHLRHAQILLGGGVMAPAEGMFASTM